MAEEGKSKYGTGFFIRLIVLMLLLGGVGYGYYQDKVGIPATIQGKLDEIDAMKDTEKANMSGIKIDEIHQILDREPDEKYEDKENGYLVETYNYARGLPFLSGGNTLKIVYKEDSFLKYLLNTEYVPSTVEKKQANFGLPPKEERIPISIGGGGGAPKQKQDEKKEDSDKGESEEGDSDEGESSDDDADTEEKKEDSSESEEKSDDKKEDEKKEDGDKKEGEGEGN